VNLAPRHLDIVFQALGDPTRRAILERLSAGPATVSDLAAPFEMTLPAILIHLRRLEAAGLVASRKEGRVRTFRLLAESYTPVRSWLDAQRAAWEARLDRMEHHARRQAQPQGKTEP
jgi:DNA-binding transcriptional ArsR family regulator